MTVSRRALADAARRMRDDPSTVVDVVASLVIAETIDAEPLDEAQIVALGWWWAVNGIAEA